MGNIIYWALIRIAFLIPALWYLIDLLDFRFWWIISIVAVYVIIFHPAIIQFNKFNEKSKEIIENTLCSSCKHFDKTAVLCMKHDKHPTTEKIPCDGIHWEPEGK